MRAAEPRSGRRRYDASPGQESRPGLTAQALSWQLAAARPPPSATLQPSLPSSSLFLCFRDVLQRLVNLLRRHLTGAAGLPVGSRQRSFTSTAGSRGAEGRSSVLRLLPAPARGLPRLRPFALRAGLRGELSAWRSRREPVFGGGARLWWRSPFAPFPAALRVVSPGRGCAGERVLAVSGCAPSLAGTPSLPYQRPT